MLINFSNMPRKTVVMTSLVLTVIGLTSVGFIVQLKRNRPTADLIPPPGINPRMSVVPACLPELKNSDQPAMVVVPTETGVNTATIVHSSHIDFGGAIGIKEKVEIFYVVAVNAAIHWEVKISPVEPTNAPWGVARMEKVVGGISGYSADYANASPSLSGASEPGQPVHIVAVYKGETVPASGLKASLTFTNTTNHIGDHQRTLQAGWAVSPAKPFEVEFDPQATSLPAKKYTVEEDYQWTSSTDASWVEVSPAQGTTQVPTFDGTTTVPREIVVKLNDQARQLESGKVHTAKVILNLTHLSNSKASGNVTINVFVWVGLSREKPPYNPCGIFSSSDENPLALYHLISMSFRDVENHGIGELSVKVVNNNQTSPDYWDADLFTPLSVVKLSGPAGVNEDGTVKLEDWILTEGDDEDESREGLFIHKITNLPANDPSFIERQLLGKKYFYRFTRADDDFDYDSREVLSTELAYPAQTPTSSIVWFPPPDKPPSSFSPPLYFGDGGFGDVYGNDTP